VATTDEVRVQQRLDPTTLAQVTALIDAATVADGVRPLNEHVMLHLRHGGDVDARHLLAYDTTGEPTLAGYAHLDVTDQVAGASTELVVHPMHRGRGHGRALVEQATTLAEQAQSPSVRLWSHGSHRSARELASRMGFTTVRSLWQMRRSLYAPIPEAPLPPGVTARPFEPGRDDDAWLALNTRAFADHPEQGDWTQHDLHRRMSEAWFDPRGFFVAERTAQAQQPRMVGFHWTKVHGGHPGHDHDALGPHEHSGHGHDPIGEVYVLGVDPDERGTGIGHALTVLGLVHLRSLGLAEVMLYVDESNSAAIGLYESLGFTHWDTDVMYARRTRRRPHPAEGTPQRTTAERGFVKR
jgi:mycothiol synthase